MQKYYQTQRVPYIPQTFLRHNNLISIPINAQPTFRRHIRSVSPPTQLIQHPIVITHYPIPIAANTFILPNNNCCKNCSCKCKFNSQKINDKKQQILKEKEFRKYYGQDPKNQFPLKRVKSEFAFTNIKSTLDRQSDKLFDLKVISKKGTQGQSQFNKMKLSDCKITLKTGYQQNQKLRSSKKLVIECCQDCYENLYIFEQQQSKKKILKRNTNLKSVWDQQRQIIKQKLEKQEKLRLIKAAEIQILKQQEKKQYNDQTNQLTHTQDNYQLQKNTKTLASYLNEPYNQLFNENQVNQKKHKYQHSQQVNSNKFLYIKNYHLTSQPFTGLQKKQQILEVYEPKNQYQFTTTNKNIPSKQKIKLLQDKINKLKKSNKKLWDMIS